MQEINISQKEVTLHYFQDKCTHRLGLEIPIALIIKTTVSSDMIPFCSLDRGQLIILQDYMASYTRRNNLHTTNNDHVRHITETSLLQSESILHAI